MPITLIFVITGLSTGGAETMLLKVLQKLDRRRFKPVVISLTTTGEIGPLIEKSGIRVHSLDMKPKVPSPVKFMCLVRLMRKLRPDIVHSWMYHADLLGGLAARIAGVKTIVWGVRQSNLSFAHNKSSTLLVMKICAHISHWLPSCILTCSEQAQSNHVAAGYDANKMVLIPNGFDLSRFLPDAIARDALREELDLGRDVPLVGLIARDDPQKNHPGFIKAAELVHKTLPQVHFVLAGAGIDGNNKSLTSLIARAGLMEYVHLLGRRQDIPRLMASFDLLASSSFGEAFPNVLGEAMACGVPCVVTDVGDSAEIVGEVGRVVVPGDMVALAQHLIELLQWPAEKRNQLGICARQRVRDRYEIGDVTRRYEEFYLQLMKGT
ncbi:glycosyltransferase [Salinisphaera sp. G21_0]|uniref:glycosyltransferase family 4 protein n=1 Tax=Salinisphaera sp. G21_0 TaxID=2821094 RepID=UPI001ADB4EE5|nr:glycosyltransferase [Salinisphaera sp. G21_0]MBO9480327.1 glycosyltransferase [Salinisphaera sp. G21_0]